MKYVSLSQKNLIVLQSALVIFLLIAVPAHAGWYTQRLLYTTWNSEGPENKEVQIKNIDFMEIEMGESHATSIRTKLDIFLWVKDRIPAAADPESGRAYQETSLALVNRVKPNAWDYQAAIYAGFDEATGYNVYRISLDGEAGKQCLELYAVLKKKWLPENETFYSNQGRPNEFFEFCYTGRNDHMP